MLRRIVSALGTQQTLRIKREDLILAMQSGSKTASTLANTGVHRRAHQVYLPTI